MTVEVTVPMEGKVFRLVKKAGDQVAENDVLIVLEAMKMEIEVVAPVSGSVQSIDCSLGQNVEADAVLAVIEAS